jgi:hypothetical protein
MCFRSASNDRRSKVSNGWAIHPISSLTATPMRFVPGSKAKILFVEDIRESLFVIHEME